MKKCQTCDFENAESMNFCLQCGAALPPTAPVTADSQELKTQSLHGVPTNFGTSKETETFANNRANFASNFSSPPVTPRSYGKIFLIIGGIAGLIILGIGGIAAIVAYNYFTSKQVVVIDPPRPTPMMSPTISPKGSIPVNSPTPADPTPVAPTPQTSFTPPTEPTKQGTFTVYANGGWQLSNIDTVPLEQFRTTLDGKIDVSGVKTGVSPGGVNDPKTVSRRLYPEFPTGALLMRTHYADGRFSNVAATSANGASGSWRNFPDERGKLEFCINDNAPQSNGGQFTVTVVMTSAPKDKK